MICLKMPRLNNHVGVLNFTVVFQAAMTDGIRDCCCETQPRSSQQQNLQPLWWECCRLCACVLQTRESSAEEKWRSVLENPGLWWNNVTTKRNPRAPDFKLKSDPSGMVALWLSSRDTPDWAKEKLESSGISAGYQSSQPSGFSDMN